MHATLDEVYRRDSRRVLATLIRLLGDFDLAPHPTTLCEAMTPSCFYPTHSQDTTMPQPIPYLTFNGNCRAAMQFYERLLGGKITIMMNGADSPMAAQIPPESAHRILHARLEFKDGGKLFAGDTPENFPYSGQKGVTISLMYDTVAEAERVFNGFADGGNVTMPWGPTFWSKMFGMVTDRFGTSWMVNGGELPV